MKSFVILAQASSTAQEAHVTIRETPLEQRGLKTSCEGRFGAIWDSNILNYIHA